MSTQTMLKDKVIFRGKAKAESDWLYNFRKLGWEYYQDEPLPERVNHLWRYTDPELFVVDNQKIGSNGLPGISDTMNGKILKPELGLAAYAANKSDLKSILQVSEQFQKAGAIIADLRTAMEEHYDKVSQYFGRLIPHDFGKFEALNMALWNTGLFIYIPDNAVIDKPIYLYRHPTGEITMTRLLMVVGKNAQATIIDDYKCPCNATPTMANSAVELFADDSSRLSYVNLQRLALDNKAFITQRTQLGADAETYTLFASLGGGIAKIDEGTILTGRGGTSNMFGVAFGDSKQRFDHHTLHHHKASDSYSHIDFKVVLKEKANSAYTGLIKIEKDALNCEAYQENRNLLLNRGPRAETIPELEILTDQVRCSHGATVGPIDPEMVFYLTSRGFSKDEAVRAIVTGFVEPTLNKMPDDLGDTIREIVLDKLEGKQNGG